MLVHGLNAKSRFEYLPISIQSAERLSILMPVRGLVVVMDVDMDVNVGTQCVYVLAVRKEKVQSPA